MKIKTTATQISGSLSVPGSKSHTIRAGLFAALAEGESKIINPLPSADCLSCMRVIQDLGAKVRFTDEGWFVTGIAGNLKQPSCVLDVGNSGTLLHFLTGIVSTIRGWAVITGDKSICTRPINDQLAALRQLGAQAFTTRDTVNAPPVILKGPVHCGTVVMEGELSQHVSGLLMAGALTSGKTRIELTRPKEIPFVKMTIDWLRSVGIDVAYDKENLSWLEIEGPKKFRRFERAIPSDWEGIAFPLAAAILTGSTLRIDHIDCSGSQGDEAIVDVLRRMGADIVVDKVNECLTVKGGTALHGITATCSDFPDALPVLSVVAAFAQGVSRFTDIGVCRLKESDRITLMKRELEKLGAELLEGPDFLEIHGGLPLHGGVVESYDDHRIAMAMAVCGMAITDGSVIVNDAECCSVSFPGFYEIMNKVGARFEMLDGEAEKHV